MRSLMCSTMLLAALLAANGIAAEEVAPADPGEAATGDEAQFKTMSGMSVLGNNEAPKSLVIVPWKSSQIGDGIGLFESLSNRPVPVDRDVFSRELNYYQIRSSAQDAGGQTAEEVRLGSR